MRQRIIPTRLELLKLRKRLALAQRGHSLLKEKEEQLYIAFRALLDESRRAREEAERAFPSFLAGTIGFRAGFDSEQWNAYRFFSEPIVWRKVSKRIFNIPSFQIERDLPSEPPPANLFHPDVYREYSSALQMLDLLMRVVELEGRMKQFMNEIRRTRRRVNALHSVLIPNLDASIRMIEFRLEEHERASRIRLKHVKSLLEEESGGRRANI
jgi:V/A-type H+-transporting ATPase subunit D